MSKPKENAAKEALKHVSDGMVVGLGSGSTAAIFIDYLGEKARLEEWDIKCVATSYDSRSLAVNAGLAVIGLDEAEKIDVAVDGADAVDGEKNLIKGYGGALVREKIVDYAAAKFVCVVDGGKLKPVEGRIPVEVLPFAAPLVQKQVKEKYLVESKLRMGTGKCGPLTTDNGNWIIDAEFKHVEDPVTLEEELDSIPGAVGNGIFTKNKPVVVIGKENGAETL